MEEILKVESLKKNFSGLTAVDDLTFDVFKGEILGIVGPNGSGKTTTINLITGFLKPTSGRILFNDQNITGMSPPQIARLDIARTFQIVSVFPTMTVEENIVAGSYLKRRDGFFDTFLQSKDYKKEKNRLKQNASDILNFLEMQDKKDVFAKDLGLGEQRNLEIGIALAAEPKLLFLDEPSGGMNPEECQEFIQLACTIQGKGITIVIIDHNMRVIMKLCHRVVVMNFGSKIAEGEPKEIANNELVISTYLGKAFMEQKGLK